MTTALIKSVLYPKPFIYLPAPINWAIDNEPIAYKEYRSLGKIQHENFLSDATYYEN